MGGKTLGVDRRQFLRSLAYGSGALLTGGIATRVLAGPGGGPFVPPASSSVVGVTGQVNGLIVQPGQTVQINGTLESTANVIVRGTLVMRPGSTLRFVNVDESDFVGGGLDVIGADTGLWVMDQGRLDVQGTPKTGWVRLAPGASAPANWQNGDRILVCPNGPGQRGTQGFRVDTFPNVNPPSPVTLAGGDSLPTECANLTRDVVIEGTPGGRAHIFLRSSPPQPHVIKYCAVRHVGPRQADGGETVGVLGRYGMHFHRAGNGSRGSLVQGVVVESSGNHAFVPHDSHGVTFRDCVAYNIREDAYWWDVGDETDDTVWDRCLAARLPDPDNEGFVLAGFLLGKGTGNVCVNCAAVGVGGRTNASGFHWPSQANSPPNTWVFRQNVAHNNERHGIFVWQNTPTKHEVDDFTLYRCGESGIDHGAYVNRYRYRGFQIAAASVAGIEWHAQTHGNSGDEGAGPRPDGYVQAFEGGTVSNCPVGILARSHNMAAKEGPTLFKDINFVNVPVKLQATEDGDPSLADFVNCNIEPEDVEIDTVSGSRFRFQRINGTAFEMDHRGRVSTIAPFYHHGAVNYFISDQDPLESH